MYAIISDFLTWIDPEIMPSLREVDKVCKIIEKKKINKNNDYVKEVICRGYYLKVTFVQNVGDTPITTYWQGIDYLD